MILSIFKYFSLFTGSSFGLIKQKSDFDDSGYDSPPFVGVVFYSLFKPATYGLCEDRSVIREACNRFLKGWKRMSGMSLLTVPFDLSCECGVVLLFLPFV